MHQVGLRFVQGFNTLLKVRRQEINVFRAGNPALVEFLRRAYVKNDHTFVGHQLLSFPRIDMTYGIRTLCRRGFRRHQSRLP